MKTTRVHCRKEDYDIIIDRTSKWGNPFSHKDWSNAKYRTQNRRESIEAYKNWITMGEGKYLLDFLPELKGKILGCWCNENTSCHGDVLIELVNNSLRKGIDI